jgi:LPXTG-motif cell wall-anchored protein
MARLWKLAAAGAISAAALTGGVAHAGNYPPDEPAPTTVVAPSGVRSAQAAPAADPQLAATGSDTGVAVKVAAGAVAAGLGLVLVARRRRHAEA